MDNRTQAAIERWIVAAALEAPSEIELLSGLCDQLGAAGFALARASVATDLLDPTFAGRGVRWLRDGGGVEEPYAHADGTEPSEDWTRSPFFALLESPTRSLRRRVGGNYRRGEFPLVDALVDAGATDYAAFNLRVAPHLRMGTAEGAVASWTTDAPAGFADAEVALLEGIMPALTLALTLRTTHRAARTIVATYLGSDAAERVLAGNIVRGRAETIRAVVWFSDLVGSTRIAEATSPEGLLALLNDYAEVEVDVIEAHGGHVLKFIGDGILAIFPGADTTQACTQALDAAAALRGRIATLNARRQAAGQPVTDAHLALHVGDLLYGNVGGPRRLDFTVLGPAVNEAARIEAFCGSLERPVIVSAAFAEAAGAARARLVSVGRYAMKGVARPQELFTPDPEIATDESQ
jgi:adenylate cyclase